MSKAGVSRARLVLRVLQFLFDHGAARVSQFDGPPGSDAQTLLVSVKAEKHRLLSKQCTLQQMLAAELMRVSNQVCHLTPTGAANLKRNNKAVSKEDRFLAQHRKTVSETVMLNGDRETVFRNLNESPLSRLKQHRCKDGTPWLSDAAFSAGERLRQDFTHAQLMPSVTSNWNAAMGGNRQSDGAGGKVEISNSALDARRRFDEALLHVGPDLTGVLIDICCYLKGFQQVEREQGWPPRSAKLMLRTALGLLASFYGTHAGAKSAAASPRRSLSRNA